MQVKIFLRFALWLSLYALAIQADSIPEIKSVPAANTATKSTKPKPPVTGIPKSKAVIAPAPTQAPVPAPASNPALTQAPTPTAPHPTSNILIRPKALPSGRISEGQKEYCNLIWNCGLPVPDGFCPDRSLVEKPKFTYDSARCLEARTLNSRGLGPGHPTLGFRLYRFLGMEYRVIYNIEEDLNISKARLAFLLADLPLAARLVSHFQKEPYTVTYLDEERNHFEGTKGKRLKGDATLVSGSAEEMRLFYFGYGTATVAWWSLKGPALMDFTYTPSKTKPNHLHYHLELLVFPFNGVINSIMNLGLFRKVVYTKIKEVLDDITETAQKLAVAGGGEILKSKDWSQTDKQKIEAFLKLP
jgi:hypothetical protein